MIIGIIIVIVFIILLLLLSHIFCNPYIGARHYDTNNILLHYLHAQYKALQCKPGSNEDQRSLHERRKYECQFSLHNYAL